MEVVPTLIMLVEDNDDHAELTLLALKNIGVVNPAIRFVDAESALDYLAAASSPESGKDHPMPGIILLDIRLPGMSGFDMLQRVKNNPKTKRIPTIMLTTSGKEEEVIKGYEHGANSYIVKPVGFDEFRKKISDLKMYWFFTSELPKPVEEIPACPIL